MIGRYQVKDLNEMVPTISFSSAEAEAKAITKEMWTYSSSARSVAHSVGGRSKLLEHEAHEWTKQIPQADLDKLSNSVKH